MKKIIAAMLQTKALQALILLATLVFFSGAVHAGRFILDATPNTANPVTVAPGATIPVTIGVLTTGNGTAARWRSTGWRISTTAPGSLTCANHANYDSAGWNVETFNMTAPATPGTYNVYYVAYSDNSCDDDASTTYIGVSAIVVAAPAPVVTSIVRASANPSEPNTAVAWTVLFSRSVTGVDAADFALIAGGSVAGASITSVTGSGTTWTVNANTGSGDGTLQLNLVDDDSVKDAASPFTALGGAGAGNGNAAGQAYAILPPAVTSIDRAGVSPTGPGTAIAWTVVFSRTVTGVDSADFTLVQGGAVSGASITSVTGSGTTWTVNANTGSGFGTLGLNLVDNDTISDTGGSKLGGTGASNGNFTGQVYDVQQPFCSPPANAPSGLTCVCDTFGRASLNPSTIFGGNWSLSNSDSISNPYIHGSTGLLRLTENTGNNAKAATAPGIFPAAGNYISVEFRHYAYNGSGADGIAVTLSDYLVPAVPGGYGGSLGYAPNSNGSKPGFAGGWVGVALDEYGNFQNPTEGRTLGPGLRADSIGVRGPGSGASGYRWIGGTASGLAIDNAGSSSPAPGSMYQVIVDARNSASNSISVIVNRDSSTKDGSNYVPMVGPINAYNEATYALNQGWIDQLIPDYWKISFTGSTGGSTNIHEIGSLRICAQTVYPSTGGTASGFSVIDDAYPAAAGSTVPAYQNFQTGNIYMKLAGVPFNVWVGALTPTGISTAYSATTDKFVSVKLVDNTDGACGTDAARTCNSTCTGKAAVESGGVQNMTFTSSNPGAKLSAPFTLNSAWKNLVAVVRECTTSSCSAFTTTAAACSADSFSVRPTLVSAITSSNATGASTFKASSGNFELTATTANAVSGYASGYTGTLKVNNAAVQSVSPATVAGQVTPALIGPAASGTSSSTATGASFTYSEVGAFRFLGYSPTVAADYTKVRGLYDGVMSASECASLTAAQCDALKSATWSGVDSVSTEGDCIAESFSNNKINGKYGCNFGLGANSASFGRFIPNHFAMTASAVVNRSDTTCTPASAFTYMSEPFRVGFTLTAMNASNAPTQNYASGIHANFTPASWHALGSNNSFGLWMLATGYAIGGGTCKAVFSNNTPSTTSFDCTGVANPANVNRAAGPRVAVQSALPTPTWTAGVASFTADVMLRRADQADGAYATLNVGIAPQDADGVGLLAATLNLDADNNGAGERAGIGSVDVRYGRLLIPNIYGSHLLPLPVPVQAQYWNGATGAYVFNGADSCTSLAASSFSLTAGAGATIATSLVGGSAMASGKGTLTLTKPAPVPTANGSVILSTTTMSPLGLPLNDYLPGKGVETFGIYKAGPVIYMRERY